MKVLRLLVICAGCIWAAALPLYATQPVRQIVPPAAQQTIPEGGTTVSPQPSPLKQIFQGLLDHIYPQEQPIDSSRQARQGGIYPAVKPVPAKTPAQG
ncbi:MAG: hypothetical protein OHK0039_47120 [Bacteroidia bacterium]